MFGVLLIGVLLVGHVVGTPLQRWNLVVHEARDAAPPGFKLVAPAAPDTVLNLRLALVQSDTIGLIDALYDVSTPSSKKYGQYLSKSEAAAFAMPAPATVDAVNVWLGENGLNATALSPAGDWLAFELSVSQANELLGADYAIFEHQATGLQTIRTLSYAIPADLKAHIDLVHPTVSFPNPAPRILSPTFTIPATPLVSAFGSNTSSPCGASSGTPWITPACLQYLYNIPTTPATNKANGIAVTGYDWEYANQADLTAFLQKFRPDANLSATFATATLDGGQNPQDGTYAGSEANLDTQYTVGLATNVPVTFISVGDDNGGMNAFLDTVNYLLSLESPPPVLSTSYGWDENQISQSFATNLCNAYAQLGARGVSILFSSGDGGVSGTSYSECTTFVPSFPSGCPYVTSVGGTAVLPDEVGAPFSGGGFSNYWAIPSYQASAVSSYLLQLGANNTGLYNASGRGYPDVAGYSVRYNITLNGTSYPEGATGTSCSTPMWASVIALLNNELLNAGKPVMGFLNPWLYETGVNALTDIRGGNNVACTNNTGFYATTGWDPVTGLGTPDFDALKSSLGM